MDNGTVGLIVSFLVAAVSCASFFNTLSVRKETALDKLAKATDVEHQISLIKKEQKETDEKIEDYGKKITALDLREAVLESQVSAQVRAVEKLTDKIDQWRDNE